MMDPTAGEPALSELFGAEARVHLADIDACMRSLGTADTAHVRASILDALHTLGGAARAAEQQEFEWLCRALERLFGAAGDAGCAAAARELISNALALAPQLIGQTSGRLRNQALVTCGQLDALTARLQQAAP